MLKRINAILFSPIRINIFDISLYFSDICANDLPFGRSNKQRKWVILCSHIDIYKLFNSCIKRCRQKSNLKSPKCRQNHYRGNCNRVINHNCWFGCCCWLWDFQSADSWQSSKRVHFQSRVKHSDEEELEENEKGFAFNKPLHLIS